MADPLAESFLEDLGCSASEAAALGERARAYLRETLPDSEEDDDADLVIRLRDARTFGAFAGSCLDEPRLVPGTRLALANRVFDLLPLPTSERVAFDPRDRVPPNLLELAAWIERRREFAPLHFLHVLYATFLDRTLVRRTPTVARSVVLRASLRAPELEVSSKVLYALLHLGAVPDSEARRELRWIVREANVPDEVRTAVARAASSPDGARHAFFEAARDQMLIAEETPEDDPRVIANAPAIPPGLEHIARRWLVSHR